MEINLVYQSIWDICIFAVRIRPICLPSDEPIRSKNFVGYMPFVAGWGRTQEGGKAANVLQELQIPVLDNEVCKDRYKKQKKLLSEKQFGKAVLCAGVLSGGHDSCQGILLNQLVQNVMNSNLNFACFLFLFRRQRWSIDGAFDC